MSSTWENPVVKFTRSSFPVQPLTVCPPYEGAPRVSRCLCSTLSPQGFSQLPAPSPSTHSIAAVGQAAAHAGAPPHRLHFLALEVSGSVNTVPNGQAIVQRWQPTQTPPNTTFACVTGSMAIALTGHAVMHQAS